LTNEDEKEQASHDESVFTRALKELDLDGSGTIHKREFVDAFLKKHHELEDQKYFIEEDIDDLELKYKVLDERVNGRGPYNVNNKGIDNLKVVVVEARNLQVADTMTGSSDPYIVINLSGQVSKTTTIPVNLNPIWKETYMFVKRHTDRVLEITVYDEDDFTQDDIIGMVDIDISKLKEGKIYDMWYELKESEDDVQEGVNPNASKLRLMIQYLVHSPPDFERERDEITEMIEARQIQLEATKEMIEMLEKPFAVFQIEKREKMMENAVSKASAPGTGEKKISDRLARMTSRAPWTIVLLIFIFMYIFFSLLACFQRPVFWDLTN